jgi:hypothetical protein
MSREIARAIIEDKLNKLRKFSYGELVKLVGQIRCDHINVPNGEEYQLETETRWDSKTGGNIRVIVAVDGPGVSAFRPLTGTFIMSADGSFIGEK